MPGVTNGIADQLDPGRMNRRIAELEGQVKELRAAKRAEATTIGGGGITVTAEGGINVVDDFGNYLATLGALTTDLPGGGTQYGWLVYRQTADGTPGTLAFSMFAGTGALPQTVGLWDNAGNTLWTDDGIAGQGIGRPYLSFPMVPWNASLWGSTSAGSWTTIAVGAPPKQQPRVFLEGAINVPTGVTAQLRLWDAINGVQIGSTVTVSSAPSGVTWSIGPAAIGGGHLGLLGLQLQAQITAGSGTVQAITYTSYGQQS